jgi:hypothetical protein
LEDFDLEREELIDDDAETTVWRCRQVVFRRFKIMSLLVKYQFPVKTARVQHPKLPRCKSARNKDSQNLNIEEILFEPPAVEMLV